MLLRVPDDLHRRLAARAAREGRSMNAVATEILDLTADADEGDRRSRLRAKAAATGAVRVLPGQRSSPARRRRIVASTRGLGPIADAPGGRARAVLIVYLDSSVLVRAYLADEKGREVLDPDPTKPVSSVSSMPTSVRKDPSPF